MLVARSIVGEEDAGFSKAAQGQQGAVGDKGARGDDTTYRPCFPNSWMACC